VEKGKNTSEAEPTQKQATVPLSPYSDQPFVRTAKFFRVAFKTRKRLPP